VKPIRLALVNPNTAASTTAAMLAIGRAAASEAVVIEGFTASFGAPLITNAAALALAADAVLALAPTLREQAFDGVVIAAFGDPGLMAMRGKLACPVTGIAEAAMSAASAGARSFAVVTTTPDLVESIAAAAARYGHGASFRGTELTAGDLLLLMADQDRLVQALGLACARAIANLKAQAIVIGGGPLALAARALALRFKVPIIEPVPEAVRLAIRRATARDR
jgi:allantoin racemase